MDLREYVIKILYISIFAILLELFLPKTKLKKYVSGFISLLAIFTIISPLFNFLKGDNIEKAIDNAIFAISKNAQEVSTDKINFDEYTGKTIVSRVKKSLEEELFTSFKEELKEMIEVKNVEVSLNENYVIEEVKVYIKGGDANIAKVILDKLIKEYQIPNSMLRIIKKGE